MKRRQATFQKKKKNQNNYSEDVPGSQKLNGEDARNVCQRTTRPKEQTEMNNTLEGINSRTTEVKELISGLEDRMVEITATKQNIRKRMKKK